MLWFLRLLAPLFGKIAAAPVLDIIDKLVADADLKEKLKAELKGKLLEREQALIAARQSLVLAELNSESSITRSWRPILMFVLMGFLLFFWPDRPTYRSGVGPSRAGRTAVGSHPRARLEFAGLGTWRLCRRTNGREGRLGLACSVEPPRKARKTNPKVTDSSPLGHGADVHAWFMFCALVFELTG
jgi:hypothetical protein